MKAATLVVASFFATETAHATQAYPCNSCTEAQVQTTARYNGETQLGLEFAIYDMTKNTIRMFVVNRKNTDTPLEPFSGSALPNRRTRQIAPLIAGEDHVVRELPVPHTVREEFNLVRKAFIATNGSMSKEITVHIDTLGLDTTIYDFALSSATQWNVLDRLWSRFATPSADSAILAQLAQLDGVQVGALGLNWNRLPEKSLTIVVITKDSGRVNYILKENKSDSKVTSRPRDNRNQEIIVWDNDINGGDQFEFTYGSVTMQEFLETCARNGIRIEGSPESGKLECTTEVMKSESITTCKFVN